MLAAAIGIASRVIVVVNVVNNMNVSNNVGLLCLSLQSVKLL